MGEKSLIGCLFYFSENNTAVAVVVAAVKLKAEVLCVQYGQFMTSTDGMAEVVTEVDELPEQELGLALRDHGNAVVDVGLAPEIPIWAVGPSPTEKGKQAYITSSIQPSFSVEHIEHLHGY